jgi:hypothetical protein
VVDRSCGLSNSFLKFLQTSELDLPILDVEFEFLSLMKHYRNSYIDFTEKSLDINCKKAQACAWALVCYFILPKFDGLISTRPSPVTNTAIPCA